MTIIKTASDQRFFFEIDLEESIKDAKLKCCAIVKDRKFHVTYENGHRFILTNKKTEKAKELIKQELKRLGVI
jgi:hypothetical protein